MSFKTLTKADQDHANYCLGSDLSLLEPHSFVLKKE